MKVFISFAVEPPPPSLFRKLFDGGRDKVETYFLEFLDENSEPTREIGLDAKGVVIFWASPESMKQSKPWNGSGGFWGSQRQLQDFREEFKCSNIEEAEFESCWERRRF